MTTDGVGENVVALRQGLERHFHEARSGESAEPTPERMAQAMLAGEQLASRGTGEARRWRVSPVLDELKRRKTIDEVMHRAACRFLEDYYLGHYPQQKSVGYGERTSRSANAASPEDTRLHYFREWQRACAAVADPMFDVVLRWVLSQLSGTLPLSCAQMTQRYAPGLGHQTAAARCGMVLSLFCAKLAQHYGMQHELMIDSCVDELSRLMQRFKADLDRANRNLLDKQETA
jgi:hypothetical protein